MSQNTWDESHKKHNTIIAVDKSRSYRVYITNSTQLAGTAVRLHNAAPTAAAGLGRVLTGAGLMSQLLLKGEAGKLTVQFKGEGPAVEILAAADQAGRVKGYISNPAASLPLRSDGKLDVGGSLGAGTLTVIRDSGQGEPYIGRIDLVTGEIADDLTAYFFISEQQSTSVALGVKIETDYSVRAAGGMIIQMLPDAQEEAVDALERMLAQLVSFSELVERYPDAEALLQVIFACMPEEYRPEPLEYRDIIWECDCSGARLEEVLISLGREQLREILEEDGQAELVCQFCTKKYHFSKSHLERLWAETI